jgi:hypothetical protein
VRLSWATFSPAPKIFLWKSPDRAEKIYACAPQEEEKLRTFFAPKSISNKCSTAWRCTLKVVSSTVSTGQDEFVAPGHGLVERGEELEQRGADEREAAVSTGCGKRSFRNTVDKSKRNRRKSLIFSARGEATGLTLQKNCPLSRTF